MKSSNVSVLAAGTLLLAFASPAFSQLTPDRTYYGVNRPAPMKVVIPADATGDAKINLYLPGGSEPTASAPVVPGGVDFASLFPVWNDPKPTLKYAQLVIGDRKVGAPVVIQPLLNPVMATAGPGRATFPELPPDFKPPYSGFRAYVEKHVVLETTMGTVEFSFRPDQAPNTVWNFMHLVEGGFYTDIIFHRIVGKGPSGAGFVIQVGDPTGTGQGGPGYNIDLENSKLPHDFGVLSMARTNDPNTNGSQVFVCLSREGTSFLDTQYTAFGNAVSGADVIEKIASVPVNAQSRPADPIPTIIRARLVDAPPFGTGPKPVTKPAPKTEGR